MRRASEFRKHGVRGLLAAAVLLLVPAAASAFFSIDIFLIQFGTPPAAAGSGPSNASGGVNVTLIDLLFSDPSAGTTPGAPSISITEINVTGGSGSGTGSAGTGGQFNLIFELISIQLGGTSVSGFGAPQVTFQRWRS